MTYLPKAALLAALMIGTAAVPLATAPALAAKKDKKAQQTGPQLTVNEKVRAAQDGALVGQGKARTAAAATGGQVTAANKAAIIAALGEAEPFLAQGDAAAQTNDELYVMQELRYRQQSMMLAAQYAGNAAGATAAAAQLAPTLDKLLANPLTPQDSVKEYAFERGRIAFQANDFRGALAYFQRARQAGSTETLNDAFIIDAKIKLGDFAGAAADAETLITRMKASGQKVPDSFYLVGIEHAYRSKNAAAAASYELKRYADYPDPKNFHDALARLQNRSATLDLRQRLDVWRLMRASKTLADQKEYTIYAMDALDAGAAREAKSLVDEYRATRGAPDAELAKAGADAATRLKTADSLAKLEATAKGGSDMQAALTAANYHYQEGQFAKAVELYKLAQSRGAPDKDALLISLGAAQAQAGDKAGAQASFQAVTSSPRKEIAAYWLGWLAQSPATTPA